MPATPEPTAFDADAHLESLSGAAMSPEPEGVAAPEPEADEAGAVATPADEAETTSDSEAGEVQSEELPESVPYEQYAEEQRASAARRHEIDQLRRRAREYKAERELILANQQAMQQTLAQMQQPTQPEYPEELLQDPAVKFFDQRMSQLDEKLSGMQQQTAEQRAAQEQMRAVTSYAVEARDGYKEAAPDWDDAYRYVRDQYGKLNFRGLDDAQREQRLNWQEHEFVRACMEQGINPAHEIYEMARGLGWKGGNGIPVTPQAETSAPPAQETSPRVRRIRKGVEQVSPSQMRGTSGTGDGRLSIEQIHALPQAKKMAIFADSDMLEELNQTGFVTLDR